jgi:alpha-mannosidase II
MQYMNSNKKMNVEVKFGTLSEYFQLVKKRNKEKPVKVKTFSGDFFTYADEMDHYWSGYFTSRPFTKRLDRLVEHYLRSAEILFSLSNLIQKQTKNVFAGANQLYKKLFLARRNLGVFQHHDGITGTSKTEVVRDYTEKYLFLIHISKNGI